MSTGTMHELRLTRTIQAPREAVWNAWTQPEQMKKWSCPVPEGVKSLDADVRVGGAFRLVMEVPDGTFTAFGSYREIDPPKRIVYSWDWEEEDHSVGETLVTVEFEQVGDATEVTLIHSGLPAPEAKDAHEEGWGACLANFEALFE